MGDVVNWKVTKSNDLVEACYKLTLNEQRLVLMAIAQIDPRKPLRRDGYYRVSAADFAAHFPVTLKQAYEAIDEGASRLIRRVVKTYDKKNQIREEFVLAHHIKYHDGEGFVEFAFSPSAAPHLSMLSAKFTTYELKQVGQLSSSYGVRMYELLKQFASTGERKISLEMFKERLALTDQYPRFFDLRRWVIDPAIKEINAHTDLTVEWDTIRKGREITGLLFIFQENPQQKLPLG